MIGTGFYDMVNSRAVVAVKKMLVSSELRSETSWWFTAPLLHSDVSMETKHMVMAPSTKEVM